MADMQTAGTVVELRVHGVSGTPPEALLGCPAEFLTQVAGDKSAGFFRRQQWLEDASGASASPGGPRSAWRRVTEAYSWGGLTSGQASRAVWLLFLPFILVNLAHWMLPPAGRRRRSCAVAVALLRLIALSFTLTLMLAAAVAVMDLMVWQCAGLDQCASRWAPLSFLASLPRGTQVALGAVPLVVMIAVLWRLGQENTRVVGRPPDPAVTADEVPLESDTFWCADPSVARLRTCHVMAWTAGLAALTVAAPVRSASTAADRMTGVTLLVADVVLLAVAVATTAWNRATARGGTGADWLTRPLLLLRWLSVGLLIASLVWVVCATVDYPAAPSHLPALRGAIYVVLGAQVALLGLLFGCVAVVRCAAPGAERPAPAWRPTLGGFTAPFVALMAWLLGGAFSVGVGLLTAQVLGDAVVSTAEARGELENRAAVLGSGTASFEAKAEALAAGAPLIVPPPYLWVALAVVVMIVVAVAAGLLVWRRVLPKRSKAQLHSVLVDYPGAGTDTADARARQVARARALASLTDLAVGAVGALAATTVVVIGVLASWYLSGLEALPEYSPTITRASVFITLSLATALVLVAVQAYRDRQMRRVVAVLWDVMTFWPRANHPLTPPCYAERTVPELLDRLRELAADPDTRVVIAAHSQGTVIAAATMLQYDDVATRARIALLTFGSPLRRLYARNFPAYFGTGALPRLAGREQHRWINLWARTDPIGSWVCDDTDRAIGAAVHGVDVRLLDVESLARRPDGTYSPICGHSGFWVRAEYRDAVTELEAALLPAGTETDTAGAQPPTEKAL
ncbi:hypothetical protein [Mycolicibacterium sp. XJ1819]